MATAEPTPPGRSRPRARVLALAAAGLAVLGAVVLVLALGDDDAPGPRTTDRPDGADVARCRPVSATPQQLAALAKATGKPIYWLGAVAGRTYEVTRTADGAVYIRYLEPGVPVGDRRPNFVTVGTYPVEEPYEELRAAAGRPGAQTQELEDGVLAVSNRTRPNSWYVAGPDAEALVEVYSPRAGRARELVRSGGVVPVEG